MLTYCFLTVKKNKNKKNSVCTPAYVKWRLARCFITHTIISPKRWWLLLCAVMHLSLCPQVKWKVRIFLPEALDDKRANVTT